MLGTPSQSPSFVENCHASKYHHHRDPGSSVSTAEADAAGVGPLAERTGPINSKRDREHTTGLTELGDPARAGPVEQRRAARRVTEDQGVVCIVRARRVKGTAPGSVL